MNGGVIVSPHPEAHDYAWMLDSLKRRQRKPRYMKKRYEEAQKGGASRCADAFLQAGIEAWVIYDVNKAEADGQSTFTGKFDLRRRMRLLEKLELVQVKEVAATLLMSIEGDEVLDKARQYAKDLEASRNVNSRTVAQESTTYGSNTEVEMQHMFARYRNASEGFDVSEGVPRSTALSLFADDILAKAVVRFDKENSTGDDNLAIGMTFVEGQLSWGCLMRILVQPQYVSELALKLASMTLLDEGGLRTIAFGDCRILPNPKLTINALKPEVLEGYCNETILQACRLPGLRAAAEPRACYNASLIIPTSSDAAGELIFSMESLAGANIKDKLFHP